MSVSYTELDVEREHPRLLVVTSFGEAIDYFISELARRGKSASTRRSYRRLLEDFATTAHDKPVKDLVLADYERFLDRWTDAKPSTLASGVSLVRSFSRYLFERGYADRDVAEPLKRPRRQRPEDVEVISVSQEDVRKLLSACEDIQELVCLASAIYLGARRAALARIRRSDVDLVRGTVRLLEKGGKVSVKPLPDEYQALLVAAERDGLWQTPNDYLIPNRRPAAVKGRERSDKIVWETVKRIAARAGVKAHVHALRAAFAVAFDAQHPGEAFTLRDLLGHTRIETTLVYLRRRDKAKAMEQVRDLSWGIVPSSQALEAHTGFEPVPPELELSEALRRRLGQLTLRAKGNVPLS